MSRQINLVSCKNIKYSIIFNVKTMTNEIYRSEITISSKLCGNGEDEEMYKEMKRRYGIPIAKELTQRQIVRMIGTSEFAEFLSTSLREFIREGLNELITMQISSE